MALAPLIPEGAGGIGVIGAITVGLLALLAWMVCYGLLYGWKHTFGALIDAITSLLTIHTPLGSINFGWPLDQLNNAVQHALSVGVKDSEKAMGLFFHAAGVIVGWMVNYMLATATVMEHAIGWLIHVYIPGRASWAASLLYPPALIAKIVRSIIAKELPHIGRQAKAVAHDATTVIYRPVKVFGRRLTKAEKAILALAAAVAGLGGHVLHPGHTLSLPKTWYGLTKRLAKLERRMHRAEGWLAAGVLAVAMANVLGISAKCLRGKGNVARVARRLCGLPATAIEDLLGLLVDILIVEDICQVVNLLSQGLTIIEGPIDTLVGVVGGSLCHGDYAAPPNIGPFRLSTPPLTGFVLA